MTRPPWASAYAVELASCGVPAQACRAVGVTRTSVRNLERLDPVFAAEIQDALDDASDELEIAARRRAVMGTLDDVYFMGQVVGQKRQYSDSLLALMLKARKPETYGKAGKLGGALGDQSADPGARADRVLQLIEQAKARKAAAEADYEPVPAGLEGLV